MGVELKAIWKNMSLQAESSEFDSQYQMYKPVTLALRRYRQENQKFKVIFDYLRELEASLGYMRP